MAHIYKVPLVPTSQPEGYIVSSSTLPELITEGDTVEEALAHVPDALAAAAELYEDFGRASPQVLT